MADIGSGLVERVLHLIMDKLYHLQWVIMLYIRNGYSVETCWDCSRRTTAELETG